MAEMVIYTKTGCPYCQAAMEDYQNNNTPYREVNVSHDAKALQLIKDKFNAAKVPVIVQDGKLVGIGFQGGG